MYSVSYDPVEVLAEFAVEHDIEYPLLSDVGSKAIKRLGLLNEITEQQSAQYGVSFKEEYRGVPHPVTFVLDSRGVVVDRLMEESYRVRMTGAALVETLIGAGGVPDDAPQAAVSGQGVAALAWLSDPMYRPWTEQLLHVSISVEDGLHVYGTPIPDGYVPLTVTPAPIDVVRFGEAVFPPARPFRIDGLPEDFHVYEGRLDVTLPWTALENVSDLELSVSVGFQTCDERACYMPAILELTLPVKGADHDIGVPRLPGNLA